MKDFQLIRQTHATIDEHLVRIYERLSTGFSPESARIKRMIQVNDCAYFVLLFAQFERFITGKASEVEGTEVQRQDFMFRVSRVIAKQHRYFSAVDQYYGWRCAIAHGWRLKMGSIVIVSVADALEEIAEAVETSPLPLGDAFDAFDR